MLNFDFLEEVLELVSPPHVMYPRNLEKKETLSATFLINTSRYDYCFVPLT